ncbi:predicted protein [Methanosarcina acetivorans C2A]|uniref:Uncharacterized protein n=1 Tax=Methanosarcina acetivorans (strain ATCC 35395 / DSM 2834 / JCM 12185 / C2A) TaxID=188937 RepID=Q8THW8_METAC|nr:predicted protein [Methanosarcina acetivorans C2A]
MLRSETMQVASSLSFRYILPKYIQNNVNEFENLQIEFFSLWGIWITFSGVLVARVCRITGPFFLFFRLLINEY